MGVECTPFLCNSSYKRLINCSLDPTDRCLNKHAVVAEKAGHFKRLSHEFGQGPTILETLESQLYLCPPPPSSTSFNVSIEKTMIIVGELDRFSNIQSS